MHGSCLPGCPGGPLGACDNNHRARRGHLACLPVRTAAVASDAHLLADLLRARLKKIGSRWRKLPPGKIALIVLATLRHDHRLADLAGGNGVSASTISRWTWEIIRLLAARAPRLDRPSPRSAGKAEKRCCWTAPDPHPPPRRHRQPQELQRQAQETRTAVPRAHRPGGQPDLDLPSSPRRRQRDHRRPPRPHRRPAARRRARRPRRSRLHRPGPRPRRPGHHHRLQGHPDPQDHPRPAPGQPGPVRCPRARRARLQRPQELAGTHPATPRPRQSHHLATRPARPDPPARHPLTDDHELCPPAPTRASTTNPAHTSPADQPIQVGTISLQ